MRLSRPMSPWRLLEVCGSLLRGSCAGMQSAAWPQLSATRASLSARGSSTFTWPGHLDRPAGSRSREQLLLVRQLALFMAKASQGALQSGQRAVQAMVAQGLHRHQLSIQA